jgi:putative ubiquitin-RnfH superfamily antitoxin RatB of RatAB toxin-antitoxin module
MEITLRKANKIQTSINDALKTIPLTTTVSINEFQNHNEVMEMSLRSLDANCDRILALNAALAEIRQEVGVKNAASQINTHLTTIATLDKNTALFTTLANAQVELEEAVIIGRLDKIRHAKDESHRVYGRSDEVSTSVMSQDRINTARDIVAENKKAKQKLQDQILELNISTKLTLSKQTVATLTAENLL